MDSVIEDDKSIKQVKPGIFRMRDSNNTKDFAVSYTMEMEIKKGNMRIEFFLLHVKLSYLGRKAQQSWN